MSCDTTKVDQVARLVDELGDPDKMSKEDYKDFLEEILCEVSMRLDCVRDELDSEKAAERTEKKTR